MAVYKGADALTDIAHIEDLQTTLDAMDADVLLSKQRREIYSFRWNTVAEKNAETEQRTGDMGFLSLGGEESRWDGTAWRLYAKPEATVSPATAGGVTLGNGTNTAAVVVAGGVATMHHKLFLGSTSVVGGAPRFTLPYPSPTARLIFGAGELYDTSADLYYDALILITGSTVFVYAKGAATASVTRTSITGAVPFTWAVGDHLEYTISWTL